MLTHNALANRAALSITISAIAVAALSTYAITMSIENSRIIELQRQEIEQHLTTISMQRQEVDTKTAELEELNIEAGRLDGDLATLQSEVQRLRDEIASLQSKIKSDEQRVVSLSGQLEFVQESTKRVKISHHSLAVINGGDGIVFPIEVEIINSGTGAISVDVSNTQYENNFQSAVRVAATVASEYAGVPISDKDIIVRIIYDLDENELATVDGSSAGALLTGMLVAGLTDREVDDKVLVTGVINPNGTIGRIGSIEEKAETAFDFGANTLLVPESQEFNSGKITIVGVLDVEELIEHLLV